MVPVEILMLEHDVGDDGKDGQGDAFLDDFQLYKVERSAIPLKSHAVGRYLTAVFKKCNAPRESNHTKQRPVVGYTRLLKTKVPIPSKRHEDVA